MRTLALIILLLAPTAAIAQKAVPVSCRFISLKGAKPPKMVYLDQEGADVQVSMRSGILSPDFVCQKRAGTIRFLNADDRELVAEAIVANGVEEAILIFGPTADDGKPPWRVFVIDDKMKTFPDGGAYGVNFYNQDMRFIIGEEAATIRPKESHGFPRPENRNEFNMAPIIFQRQDRKQEWVTVSETMVRFNPGLRYLILTEVDPSSGRPRITTVKDFKKSAQPAR